MAATDSQTSKASYPYSDSLAYYQRSILSVFNSALDSYGNILLPEERKTLEGAMCLPNDPQRLLFRLYLRKASWLRVEKLSYNDICNIPEAIHDLVEASLLHELDSSSFSALASLTGSDFSQFSSEEFLEVLQLSEIKILAKNFNVAISLSGKSCEHLIKSLISMKYSGQKRLSVFIQKQGDKEIALTQANTLADRIHCQIVEKVLKLTGKIVKITEIVNDVFKRVISLFFLDTKLDENSLSAAILADLNRRQYPSYEIVRSRPIFANRDQFIAYEEAQTFEVVVREAVEKLEETRASEGTQENNQLSDLKHLLEETKMRYGVVIDEQICFESGLKRSFFLRRYTAGYVLTRLLSDFVSWVERYRDYTEANKILDQLLSQKVFGHGWRGSWWERLVLNLSYHLGEKPLAILRCKEGLQDEAVRGSFRLSLERRLHRLTTKGEFVLDVEPDILTIYADPERSHVRGQKLLYLLANGSLGSVEEVVLSQYEYEGWHGFHCESSLYRTLFTLIFWDILFCSAIPDVFQNPFQTHPLDLMTDAFYEDRREQIEERLEEISAGSGPQLLINAYYSFYGCQVLGISDWDQFPLRSLLDICHTLGGDNLSALLRPLAEDYARNCSGLPDLFLYKPDRSEYMLLEVKSTRDRFSDAQRNWNSYFRKHGIKFYLCRVLETNYEGKEPLCGRPKK